jgi:SpoIID/LytB domain protein
VLLLPTGNGSVQAVLSTSMQEYLYGLGEMPSSWPAEALRAQAIAARTYAQKKVNAAGGGGSYDIVGGLPDQSYLAYEKEAGAMGAQWVGAVDSTNTQVVTYGGQLIDAVYSASSGGHTENSETVWVSPVPYLRGVADPADLTGGNPNGSWARSYTGSQLGAWFGIGQVTSVQVLGPVGVSGRVDKATIRLTGTGGTRDVQGASFRSWVNAASPSSQLMSTKFTVSGGLPAGPAPVNLPGGVIELARSSGRTIAVAGVAIDPEGAPRVRVVSTMRGQVAVREVQTVDGRWAAMWNGEPGTRTICVTLLDTPTGQGVPIGCRDVTVK